jgi:hypothetical protein
MARIFPYVAAAGVDRQHLYEYMSSFGRLWLDIRHGRVEIENTQKETQGAAQAGNRAAA